MVRITLFVLLFVVVACNEVPAAPGTGGTGGGAAGGSSGTGGDGGTGGDPTACSAIPVKEHTDLESGDLVQLGVGIGQVEGQCPGNPCEGADAIDRWAFTACGRSHQVELTWDDSRYNLDLFVYRSDDTMSWAKQGDDTMEEVITAELEDGEQYLIQVQAIDTLDVPVTYNLSVRNND